MQNKQIHRTITKTCEPNNQKQAHNLQSPSKWEHLRKTTKGKATYPHTTQNPKSGRKRVQGVKDDDTNIRRPKRQRRCSNQEGKEALVW